MKFRIFRTTFCILATAQLIACQGSFDSLEGTANRLSTIDSQPTTAMPDGSPPAEVSAKANLLLLDIDTEIENINGVISDLEKQEKVLKRVEILAMILGIAFKSTKGGAPQEKLSNPIKSITGKIKRAVEKAYDLDERLLTKMAELEPYLDPNNPRHMEAIEKFDELKEKLEGFEDKMDIHILKLSEKVGSIIRKIDIKIGSYVFFDPRAYLLKKAKKYFVELQGVFEDSLAD